MDAYLLISITVSFLIAALSGLGVGSGGLFVIWLTATSAVSLSTARGLNLLFFVFSAGGAFIIHLKRRKIRFSLVGFLALFAALGTALGSLFGSLASPTLIKRLFGIMLVISGIRTLFYSDKSADPGKATSHSVKYSQNQENPIDFSK